MLQADHEVFYGKLRNYHWTVKGPRFFELHQLFEQLREHQLDAPRFVADALEAHLVEIGRDDHSLGVVEDRLEEGVAEGRPLSLVAGTTHRVGASAATAASMNGPGAVADTSARVVAPFARSASTALSRPPSVSRSRSASSRTRSDGEILD